MATLAAGVCKTQACTALARWTPKGSRPLGLELEKVSPHSRPAMPAAHETHEKWVGPKFIHRRNPLPSRGFTPKGNPKCFEPACQPGEAIARTRTCCPTTSQDVGGARRADWLLPAMSPRARGVFGEARRWTCCMPAALDWMSTRRPAWRTSGGSTPSARS